MLEMSRRVPWDLVPTRAVGSTLDLERWGPGKWASRGARHAALDKWVREPGEEAAFLTAAGRVAPGMGKVTEAPSRGISERGRGLVMSPLAPGREGGGERRQAKHRREASRVQRGSV